MKAPALSQVFNKFVGQEVPLMNKPVELNGKKYDNLVLENDPDPVLEDMKKFANDMGFSLRVFWPGVAGTMDYCTDRVNAHIEQAADGKWRVANRFTIG